MKTNKNWPHQEKTKNQIIKEVLEKYGPRTIVQAQSMILREFPYLREFEWEPLYKLMRSFDRQMKRMKAEKILDGETLKLTKETLYKIPERTHVSIKKELEAQKPLKQESMFSPYIP